MEKGAIASSLVIVRSILGEACILDYIFKSHLSHQRNHVKKFRKKLLDVVFLFVLLSKDCSFKMRTCPVGVIWVLWAEKQPFR